MNPAEPKPKDDVSSAPESGDKSDEPPPMSRSPATPARPGKDRDDPSRAPESGDKPDADE